MAIKIGIIGAGTISYPHVHAYVKNKNVGEIVVAEINEQARGRLCERYGIKKSTAHCQELLNDPSIDMVDVLLPSYLHQPVSIEAMKAGKHVICEKPLALNAQGVEEMIGVSKSTGKRLFGILNQRFMPMHEKARALIDKGEIGTPMFMTCFLLGNEIDRLNDPANWKGDRVKSGGGVLIDAGIHHVDLMNFFLGQATTVSASLKRVMVKPAHKEEDNAFVTVDFRGGSVGTLAASFSMTEYPWTEPKTIYGTGGTIVMDDSTDAPLRLIKATKKGVCDDGFTRCQEIKAQPIAIDPVPTDNPNPGWYYSLGRCVNDFIEAIANNKESVVTLEDSRRAIGVISAAYESFRSGRRVDV